MKTLIICASVAIMAAQGAAFAGAHYINPVYVASASGYATGSVVSGASGAGLQYITCGSSSSPTGTPEVTCTAYSSSGQFLFCYAVNPPSVMRDTVAGINTTSNITFYSNTSTGQCTFIFVTNGSQYGN
jgi:hypothetical protein